MSEHSGPSHADAQQLKGKHTVARASSLASEAARLAEGYKKDQREQAPTLRDVFRIRGNRAAEWLARLPGNITDSLLRPLRRGWEQRTSRRQLEIAGITTADQAEAFSPELRKALMQAAQQELLEQRQNRKGVLHPLREGARALTGGKRGEGFRTKLREKGFRRFGTRKDQQTMATGIFEAAVTISRKDERDLTAADRAFISRFGDVMTQVGSLNERINQARGAFAKDMAEKFPLTGVPKIDQKILTYETMEEAKKASEEADPAIRRERIRTRVQAIFNEDQSLASADQQLYLLSDQNIDKIIAIAEAQEFLHPHTDATERTENYIDIMIAPSVGETDPSNLRAAKIKRCIRRIRDRLSGNEQDDSSYKSILAKSIDSARDHRTLSLGEFSKGLAGVVFKRGAIAGGRAGTIIGAGAGLMALAIPGGIIFVPLAAAVGSGIGGLIGLYEGRRSSKISHAVTEIESARYGNAPANEIVDRLAPSVDTKTVFTDPLTELTGRIQSSEATKDEIRSGIMRIAQLRGRTQIADETGRFVFRTDGTTTLKAARDRAEISAARAFVEIEKIISGGYAKDALDELRARYSDLPADADLRTVIAKISTEEAEVLQRGIETADKGMDKNAWKAGRTGAYFGAALGGLFGGAGRALAEAGVNPISDAVRFAQRASTSGTPATTANLSSVQSGGGNTATDTVYATPRMRLAGFTEDNNNDSGLNTLDQPGQAEPTEAVEVPQTENPYLAEIKVPRDGWQPEPGTGFGDTNGLEINENTAIISVEGTKYIQFDFGQGRSYLIELPNEGKNTVAIPLNGDSDAVSETFKIYNPETGNFDEISGQDLAALLKSQEATGANSRLGIPEGSMFIRVVDPVINDEGKITEVISRETDVIRPGEVESFQSAIQFNELPVPGEGPVVTPPIDEIPEKGIDIPQAEGEPIHVDTKGITIVPDPDNPTSFPDATIVYPDGTRTGADILTDLEAIGKVKWPDGTHLAWDQEHGRFDVIVDDGNEGQIIIQDVYDNPDPNGPPILFGGIDDKSPSFKGVFEKQGTEFVLAPEDQTEPTTPPNGGPPTTPPTGQPTTGPTGGPTVIPPPEGTDFPDIITPKNIAIAWAIGGVTTAAILAVIWRREHKRTPPPPPAPVRPPTPTRPGPPPVRPAAPPPGPARREFRPIEQSAAINPRDIVRDPSDGTTYVVSGTPSSAPGGKSTYTLGYEDGTAFRTKEVDSLAGWEISRPVRPSPSPSPVPPPPPASTSRDFSGPTETLTRGILGELEMGAAIVIDPSDQDHPWDFVSADANGVTLTRRGENGAYGSRFLKNEDFSGWTVRRAPTEPTPPPPAQSGGAMGSGIYGTPPATRTEQSGQPMTPARILETLEAGLGTQRYVLRYDREIGQGYRPVYGSTLGQDLGRTPSDNETKLLEKGFSVRMIKALATAREKGVAVDYGRLQTDQSSNSIEAYFNFLDNLALLVGRGELSPEDYKDITGRDYTELQPPAPPLPATQPGLGAQLAASGGTAGYQPRQPEDWTRTPILFGATGRTDAGGATSTIGPPLGSRTTLPAATVTTPPVRRPSPPPAAQITVPPVSPGEYLPPIAFPTAAPTMRTLPEAPVTGAVPPSTSVRRSEATRSGGGGGTGGGPGAGGRFL